MSAVSVVIRCYNEASRIERVLVGIRSQTLKDVEIIVVDSGSVDATVEIASRYTDRIIHIKPEQFTFGRSLNLGCAHATAPVIVIASAHVYPTHDDWLERLSAPFADPTVGMVYGCQRGDVVTRYAEHRIFRRWFPDRSNPDQRQPFCNNANAAIRKTEWEKRPYNENLTGLEDLDWAQRMLADGKRLVYDAEAVVIHVHEEGPLKVFNRYRREAMAMRRIRPDLRLGLLDFLYMLTTNIVCDLYHATVDRRLFRVFWEVIWFRLAQSLGTYRGQYENEVTAELKRAFYYPGGFSRQDFSAAQDWHRKGRIDYSGAGLGRSNAAVSDGWPK